MPGCYLPLPRNGGRRHQPTVKRQIRPDPMKERKMKKAALVALTLAVFVSVGIAQGPKRTINPRRNPNLAAAQRHLVQAYDKISDAQRKSEFSGHAKRAKELLAEANKELELAAQEAEKK
jgi:hypothetical protein